MSELSLFLLPSMCYFISTMSLFGGFLVYVTCISVRLAVASTTANTHKKLLPHLHTYITSCLVANNRLEICGKYSKIQKLGVKQNKFSNSINSKNQKRKVTTNINESLLHNYSHKIPRNNVNQHRHHKYRWKGYTHKIC